MQLATATAATAATSSAPPRFSHAIGFEGAGIYSEFVVTPGTRSYGRAAGYASLDDAIRSLSRITTGERNPAAGIFEHDGRYHARALRVAFDYDDQLGDYRGPWKLEQNVHDLRVLSGDEPGYVTRDAALRAIVDGVVAFDATRIPVDAAMPR